MPRFFVLLCLALVALLLFAHPRVVRAQDEDAGADEDAAVAAGDEKTTIRYSAEEIAAMQAARAGQNAAGYIEADWVFPDHPDQKLHAGENTHLAVSITNTGQSPFTILYARGTLYYNQDAGYSIENYTVGVYELPVNPGEQRSVQYYFTPHQMLDIGEYGLYAKLYYQDVEGLNYTVTFFNQTIEIVDPESTLDTEYFIKLGTTGLAVLLAVFLVVRSTTASSDAKKKKPAEYPSFTPSGTDEDWLAQTAATKSKKTGTPSR